MQARKLTLVEIGVGGLPSASPVAPRFSTWFPVPFKAPDVPPANGVNPTPVADGVVLEWDAVDLEGVIYVISRSESQNGPWLEIHRTTETRYVYNDGSGNTWWFQITPTVRGKTGAGTVVGVTPPTTSTDLAEQQSKLAAEISARIQAIADEAEARAAGLAQAAQDLVAEALLRQQGVSEALQAISAEAQARIDAILNEKLAREAAISREEQLRQSADESLARAVSEVAAGSGTQFDSIKLWPFNQTIEGWTGNGAPTLVDGWLRPANHASAPWVQSPVALAIDGSAYRFVKLRVKRVGAPAWGGFLQWITTTDQAWNAQKRAAIAEPAWDVNGVATVDVQDIAWWPATVDAIRLQLGPAQTLADYYLVDYIAVGRPQPGASVALVQEETQARITADAAEASQRTALAVQMRGNYTGTDPAQLTAGLAYEELRARVAADQAQVLRISTMEARMPAGAGSLATSASVTALQEATATTTNALAQSITSINVSLQNIGGDNLLPNSSFEDRPNDLSPPTWWVWGGNAPSTTRSYVDSDLPGSVKALRVASVATAAAGQYIETRTPDKALKVSPGQKYVASAFVRNGGGPASPALIIWFLDANGATIGSAAQDVFTHNENTWRRLVSTPRAAPANAAFARVYYRTVLPNSGAAITVQMDWDNVQFQQGEVATQWAASTNELQGTINATASALSGLTSTVTQLGSTVDSQSSLITALRNDVTDVGGRTNANAEALQQLGNRVTSAEGRIETVSSSVTKLSSQLDGIGGDNLLSNSSYEVSPTDTSVPTGWQTEGTMTAVSYSYVPSPLPGGGRAFRISATSTAVDQYVGLATPNASDKRVPIQGGQDYVLSTYLRGTQGNIARTYVQWMKVDGSVAATSTMPDLVLTSQWQRAVLTMKAPADAVTARVFVGRMFARGAPGGCALELDNVMLQRGLVAGEYRPSGQEAISATTANSAAISNLTTRLTSTEGRIDATAQQITDLRSGLAATFNRGENLNTNALFDGSLYPWRVANASATNGLVEWVSGGGQTGSAASITNKVGSAASPTIYANDGAWIPLKVGRSGRKLRSVIVARAAAGTPTITARCRIRGSSGEGSSDQTITTLSAAWQRFELEHPVGDDRSEVMCQVWVGKGAGTADATVLFDRIEFYDVTDEITISANASALTALSATVTQQGGKLDATAENLTSLKTQVGDVSAAGFNQLKAQVVQDGQNIETNATAIQGVRTSLDGKADASVVQTMRASQAGSGNLLTNSAFRSGSAGWAITWNPGGWSGSVSPAGADWDPEGGKSIGGTRAGAPGNDQWCVYGNQQRIPIVAGKFYIFSAYMAAHRAGAHIGLGFYNAAGTQVAAIYSQPVTAQGGRSLASWARGFVIMQAPAGAVFAMVELWGGTQGQTANDGFFWHTNVMLEEAREGQTQPSPYSPGGLESSAEWRVDVQAGAKIGGIKLGVNGQVSAFDVLAEVFRVSSPSGGRRTEYSDGHWRCYDEFGVMRARFGVWG